MPRKKSAPLASLNVPKKLVYNSLQELSSDEKRQAAKPRSVSKTHIARMALRRRRNAAGICAYCGELPNEENRIGCKDCGKGHSRINSKFCDKRQDRVALYRKRNRKKVTEKYGGACTCCGEKELLFLTIDHINGDGLKDRLDKGGWFMKLLRLERRSDLQVLCYNCNMGREVNGGVCPHVNPSPADIWNYDLRHLKRFNTGCKYSWPDDTELVRRYNELGGTAAAATVGAPADALMKRLQRHGLWPKNKKFGAKINLPKVVKPDDNRQRR